MQLATVICRLVVQGAELGSLDRRPERFRAVGAVGERSLVSTLPVEWLMRLARAIEVGGFDRFKPGEIVDRILVPLSTDIATTET